MHPSATDASGITRHFVPVALAVGVLFVFLTPPFQVPDEPAHFFRAYAVSEGTAFAVDANGKPGAVLPASLPSVAASLLGATQAEIRRYVPPDEILTAIQVPLEPERRVFLPVPPGRKPSPISFSAVAYLPIFYLPAAAAVGFGKLLGASPLLLLYAARLVHLGLAILLLRAGLAWAPFGGRTAAIVALFPISIVLRSSASPDAILYPLAFLFVAGVFRAFSTRVLPSPAATGVLGASAFLIAVGRAPYALLALLTLALPSSGRAGRALASRLFIPACAAAGVVASIAWMKTLPGIAAAEGLTINASLRMRQAFASPLAFISETWHHMTETGPEYAREIVGNLGWLDHPLPIWLVTAVACGAVLVAIGDGPAIERFRATARAWTLLVCAGSVLALVFVLHIGTPFEAGFLTGFQGRYALPFVWPFLMILGLGSGERSATARWRDGLTAAVIVLAILGAVATTLEYYSR